MIAFLKGTIDELSPAKVILNVNNVGYDIHISLHTYTQISNLTEVKLFTYLLIREDAHILYGFYDQEERNIFLQLIAVSGIGAATTRVMLSSLKPEELALAIAAGNTAVLERIKGIGKKSAERIIVELKDKFNKGFKTQPINTTLTGNKATDDVLKEQQKQMDALDALMALGIARIQAENAIKKAITQHGDALPLEDLIKKALQVI